MLTKTEINDCIEVWKRTQVYKGATLPKIYYENYPSELWIAMTYMSKKCRKMLNNPDYICLKYALDTMWEEISRTCNHYEKSTTDNWCQNNLIKDVIFNYPATIVFWSDGTKTVVQARDDDVFDPEKGLAMAIVKKSFGNKGNYYNQIKKWLPKPKCIHTECYYYGNCNPDICEKCTSKEKKK